MKALLLAAALATAAVAAPAAELTFGVHAYTYHLDRSQGFNNYNPGAYVAGENWVAGAYYNSERHASAYAGYLWRHVAGTPIDLTIGAVTGYKGAALKPLIVPSVLLGNVRVSFLPTPDKHGRAVHFSWEF